MGNCRSGPAVEASRGTTGAPIQPMNPPTASTGTGGGITTAASSSQKDSGGDQSTSAFIQALLPIVLPIVRHVASQQLISDHMIICKEELVKRLDKSNLPIGPVDVSLDHIRILDPDTLEKDMKAMPEFAWPESERYRSLMKSPSEGAEITQEGNMVVMDITGVTLTARLAPGIELTVPVEGPMGLSANLEVGTGGTISQAKFYLEVPRLRVWFVNEPRYKMYVAFLERPKILPQVHINVDRGRGDFLHMEFKGGGGLDDIIESILCGFGPSSLTHKSEETTSSGTHPTTAKTTPENRSWVADALGRRISEALGVFAGVGKDRPLEIDLHESIQAGIDAALGKTRSVEEIEADIEALKAELKFAKESPPPNTKGVAFLNHEEKKDDDVGSYFILEEEDATRATADVAPTNCFFCAVGV
jgi:hypothetical protein